MKQNGAAVRGTKPLPENESASVPAVAAGSTRYLFASPTFRGGDYEENIVSPSDETLTLSGVSEPKAVKLLGDGSTLKYSYADRMIKVDLPASKRTKLVDVVQVEF